MTATHPAIAAPVRPGPTPDRDWSIEPLWRAAIRTGGPVRGGVLPPELQAHHAAPLEIPLHPGRPTIIANFVTTLDGVVALDRLGATGGREISGGSEPDRFLMGLLRATADAVLLGAGTFRASGSASWTPGAAHPPSSPGFAAWRRALDLPPGGPATVIVSGSGSLDLGRLSEAGPPVVILTSRRGARGLEGGRRPRRVEVVAVADGPDLGPAAVLPLLHERGHRLVLSEAGPRLFGGLLQAGEVDELFLTIAPQLVGRSAAAERLALVEGVGFAPEHAPWAQLRSAMHAADHLFLRYDLRSPTKETP